MERFDGHEYRVVGSKVDVAGLHDGGDRQGVVAEHPLELQTVLVERCNVLGNFIDKDNLKTGFGQLTAQDSPNRTRTTHDETHWHTPPVNIECRENKARLYSQQYGRSIRCPAPVGLKVLQKIDNRLAKGDGVASHDAVTAALDADQRGVT